MESPSEKLMVSVGGMNRLAAIARKSVKEASRAILNNRVVDFRLSARHSDRMLLTFDDGPHPVITPRVLDLLDTYGARGVFFVIGERAEKEPELLRQISSRGHVLANHTYSHLNDHRGGTYSLVRCLEDVLRCREVVRSIAGVETTLLRPPRGEINIQMLLAARRSGHRVVNWSLEGGEWGCRAGESGEAIARFVLDHARQRDILLLHDDNEKSVTVLESLLPHARRRGFDLSPPSTYTKAH